MDHGSRKHAKLSASGAHRWMNCTPAPHLEEEFPDKSSSFSLEGTLAHELADIQLKYELDIYTADEADNVYNQLKETESFDTYFYDGMTEEAQKYVDICMDAYRYALSKGDAEAFVEERLDFSEYVENGFGTGDFSLIADGTAEIIDLKFGKGVKVDAEFNEQLMLYGLGLYLKYELAYDIHTIKMTIVQPRLDHVSEFSMSVEELLEWAEKDVKPKALLAYEGEGEQVVGDWCKFCKAKAVCAAQKELAYQTAVKDFEVTDDGISVTTGEHSTRKVSDSDILEVYRSIGWISDYLSAVDEYVKAKAIAGQKWEGYKLVEATTRRKITHEKDAIAKLKGEGFPEAVTTITKLKGITDLEKSVGKINVATILADFIEKPEGAPVLVPISDKRPEYVKKSTADEDFA